ncbi:MAG: nucleoside triphosphate pyrophosphohydrolase [Clostridia bacterium]|nr:nucleoside triphosphate pyrophosphohydrolase [Clostridia bacterium]
MITVIGCGIEAEDISQRAWQTMLDCDNLVLQTDKLDIFTRINELRETFTCDSFYEECEDFDGLSEAIAEHLCSLEGEVCYGVFGSGLDDTAVGALRQRCDRKNIPFRLMPGVSLADRACAECGIVGTKRVLTATEACDASFDAKETLVITGMDSALIAGRIKCRLLDRYDGEQEAFIYSHKGLERIELYRMDRLEGFYHTTALVVPGVEFDRLVSYTTEDLVHIMRILRGADGCPWDKEQTHKSLTRYLIEEAYEVADAVEKEDPYSLADELGDVLLQVVFHARIASEHADFTYDDTVNAVCKKMIERHPHIFGSAKADSADEVLDNWEKIKKEQRHQTDSEVLKSVPVSLPALMRAEKVGDKARHAGFDFEDAEQALIKLREEIEEFVLVMNDADKAREEMGDLLFSAVNLARKCGIQPEMALNKATDKFVERFCRVEEAVNADGYALKDISMKTFDEYWDRLKHS